MGWILFFERGLWVVKNQRFGRLCNLFFLYFEILYQGCMENKVYVTILCGIEIEII